MSIWDITVFLCFRNTFSFLPCLGSNIKFDQVIADVSTDLKKERTLHSSLLINTLDKLYYGRLGYTHRATELGISYCEQRKRAECIFNTVFTSSLFLELLSLSRNSSSL